jgi:hypothetical protein
MNMVARATHIQSILEIYMTEHGYQTHQAGHPRQHLLSVGVLHPV